MKLLKILPLLLSGLCLSCSQEELEPDALSREVQFDISREVLTRSGKVQFEQGDSIGIYVVRRTGDGVALPQASGNQAHNAKWIYGPEGWEPATPLDKVLWDQDGSALDFYAYYPYSPEATDPTAIPVTVPSDQRSEAALLRADMLRAANQQGLRRGTVELQFTHALALVDVTFSNVWGSELKMELSNVARSATLNLGTGEQTPLEYSNIQLDSIGDLPYHYQAIVPAQTLQAGATLFGCDVDGITSAYRVENTLILKPGERKIFKIKISD